MATYVVAVSGGVDSVVLLDMLTRSDHRLIVAHVEHGIRGDDSAADASERSSRVALALDQTETIANAVNTMAALLV